MGRRLAWGLLLQMPAVSLLAALQYLTGIGVSITGPSAPWLTVMVFTLKAPRGSFQTVNG